MAHDGTLNRCQMPHISVSFSSYSYSFPFRGAHLAQDEDNVVSQYPITITLQLALYRFLHINITCPSSATAVQVVQKET